MDLEANKFGRGPRELTGAIDLISQYKLRPFHEFFCKKPLPASVAETHYFHNVVGDTELRKGDGMQLGQLIQGPSSNRDGKVRILPIGLHVLGEAFHLRETANIELPPDEKGVPTIAERPKSEFADKDKKQKKKDKEHKKRKHHKEQGLDKEKNKDKSAHVDHTKNHSEKRKEHDNNQDAIDAHKPKRSKHNGSARDELGRIKVPR